LERRTRKLQAGELKVGIWKEGEVPLPGVIEKLPKAGKKKERREKRGYLR